MMYKQVRIALSLAVIFGATMAMTEAGDCGNGLFGGKIRKAIAARRAARRCRPVCCPTICPPVYCPTPSCPLVGPPSPGGVPSNPSSSTGDLPADSCPISVVIDISGDCMYELHDCVDDEYAGTAMGTCEEPCDCVLGDCDCPGTPPDLDLSDLIEPEDPDGASSQPASEDGTAKKFRVNKNSKWVSKTEFPHQYDTKDNLIVKKVARNLDIARSKVKAGDSYFELLDISDGRRTYLIAVKRKATQTTPGLSAKLLRLGNFTHEGVLRVIDGNGVEKLYPAIALRGQF